MITDKIDIYNYERIYKSTIERIKKNDRILPANKSLLVSFGEARRQGTSLPCVIRYLVALNKLAPFFNKSLEEITLEDVIRLFNLMDTEIRKMDGSRYSVETIRDDKIGFRELLKFLKRKDLTDEISIKAYQMHPPNPALLWDEKELFRLISSVKDSVQDQALVALVAESGCRIGELGSMKLENVITSATNSEIQDNEALIQVNGKTGNRSILILWSSAYLKKWITIHPLKNDQKAPLWIRRKNKKDNIWIPRRYGNLAMTLKRAVEASGIHKPSNPHAFRKSICTILRKKLYDETLIKKRFGWSRNSDVISIYDSVLDSDLWKEERRVNGVVEEIKKITPTLRQCPFCMAQNPFDLEKCQNCGQNMNISEGINKLKFYEEQFVKISKQLEVLTSNYQTLLEVTEKNPPKLTDSEKDKVKKAVIKVLEFRKL